MSKIVYVTPKEFRDFSVSTPFGGKITNCLVMVESKFSKGVD
jgi:hypothetical protein